MQPHHSVRIRPRKMPPKLVPRPRLHARPNPVAGPQHQRDRTRHHPARTTPKRKHDCAHLHQWHHTPLSRIHLHGASAPSPTTIRRSTQARSAHTKHLAGRPKHRARAVQMEHRPARSPLHPQRTRTQGHLRTQRTKRTRTLPAKGLPCPGYASASYARYASKRSTSRSSGSTSMQVGTSTREKSTPRPKKDAEPPSSSNSSKTCLSDTSSGPADPGETSSSERHQTHPSYPERSTTAPAKPGRKPDSAKMKKASSPRSSASIPSACTTAVTPPYRTCSTPTSPSTRSASSWATPRSPSQSTATATSCPEARPRPPPYSTSTTHAAAANATLTAAEQTQAGRGVPWALRGLSSYGPRCGRRG